MPIIDSANLHVQLLTKRPARWWNFTDLLVTPYGILIPEGSMKHQTTLLSAIVATLVLTACATAEFRQAAAECRVQAQASYPVVLEQRLFRRSRDAWVPDGSTICESSVITTSNDNRRKTTRSDEADDGPDDARRKKKQMSGDVKTVRERSNAMSMETTRSTQVCRPGLRKVVEYYDEPATIDVNADARESQIASCAAVLCVQRFGNDRCKKQ